MDFNVAYELHVDDVFGYLAFRTGSWQTAEALTQETFERAVRGWASFDPEHGAVRTWLVTIARNVYVDSRRRGSSRPESAGEVGAEVIGEDLPKAALDPEPEVASALRRLERREREAIALRFGGDMRVAEIAEVLGVSTSNAQQILSRALRRLRGFLDA